MIARRCFLKSAAAPFLTGAPFFAPVGAAPFSGPRPAAGKEGPPRPRDQAPVPADAKLGGELEALRAKHHLPGLIGAVIQDGRPVAIGAAGARKIGADAPMLTTDLVHIGSCTKAMTATMIGTVIEEGRLDWGSTIGGVFPDVAARLHPDYRKVTLSQLLTHRAGLPANVPWVLLPGKTTTDRRRAILTMELVKPPEGPPGSKFAYSNVGYALAGLMAEQATGEPWEDLMRHRLFGPLEMASAGFGAPGRRGELDQPWGHRLAKGGPKPSQQDNAAALGPAGTVHCTIADWSKFAALHLAAARGHAKLLDPATFEKLQSPPPGADYAAGWTVVKRPWAGGRALTHGGSNTFWMASVWLAPAKNLGLLAVTNLGGKEAATAVDETIGKMIEYARDVSKG